MSTLNLTRPDRSTATASSTVIIGLLIVGGLLIVLLVAAVPLHVSTQIFYGSVVLFMLGLAAALIMAKGETLMRSLASGRLGPYFGLSTAIIFGLASLTWLGNPSAEQAALIAPRDIVLAMVLVGIGLGCFVAGYMAVTPGHARGAGSLLRRVLLTERTVRPGQWPAWVLMGVALIADAILLVGGNFGYLSDVGQLVSSPSPLLGPLTIFSSFSVFAIALSANDYARRRRRSAVLSFSILLILQSWFGVFSGNKETLALGFVAALLGYGARMRRLPIVPVSAAALLFVFVVMPFNTNYRNAINVGSSRLSPMQALQAFWGQGIGSLLTLTQNTGEQSPQAQALLRITRIGDVAIIAQKTPSEISYRPLTELLEAPAIGLVPRVVWPDKPILATGYVFSQEYYGLPSYVYTSHAVTPQGDLWRHGGWPVLVVGMVLLGLGVRVLDVATVRVSDFPLCLLLILSFFPYIVKQEIDVVSFAAAVPTLLLSVAIASRLVMRPKMIGPRAKGLDDARRDVQAHLWN
jgi:hypothetical protein